MFSIKNLICCTSLFSVTLWSFVDAMLDQYVVPLFFITKYFAPLILYASLTLSRATALFGTTRDLIEWARALFGTISIWPTLSSHSSRSLRLSLKPIYNRHCLVLFYLCTKL